MLRLPLIDVARLAELVADAWRMQADPFAHRDD